MKPIQSSIRLRPLSHIPGTRCLVPYSGWEVQAFPTQLFFYHLITGEKQAFPLKFVGPVFDFTLELDLEKGGVHIFGTGANGYERYTVSMEEKWLRIVSQKGKQRTLLPTPSLAHYPSVPKTQERLSLGSHKILDWDLVKRRRDLTEILPVWFRLGQMVPEVAAPKCGAATLLKESDKMDTIPNFLKLFMAGFQGILSPRLHDEYYQGIIPPIEPTDASPLILLTEGAKLIRGLFFREVKERLNFLPSLPPEFHAGRLLNLKTSAGDRIDLEWSKKLLRRVTLRVGQTRSIHPRFQKALKSYRIQGKRVATDAPLHVEAGSLLQLDRFEG